MNSIRRSRLQECRDEICKDLDVNDIIDQLIAEKILTYTEKERIFTEGNRNYQVRCLLDILLEKDNANYDKFVKLLYMDYMWLANDLFITLESGVTKDELDNDAFLLGDIPQLPQNFVPRTTEIEKLQVKLEKLKRENYVVIHGFPGMGKSILAISAIRTMQNKFKNKFFFINAGEAKTQSDIFIQLYRLYLKIVKPNDEIYKLDTKIFFDFEKNGIEIIKDALKKAFNTDTWKEALLILDDVSTFGLVKAFDFGCKVLITTRDKSLVPANYNIDYFELNKGFEEREAIKMFDYCTKSLEIDNFQRTNIQKEMTNLHFLCKGYPMTISLIGIALKDCEDIKQTKNQLEKFNQMFLARKSGWKKILIYRQKKGQGKEYRLDDVIKDCLTKLSKDCYECYRKFALFVEDINVTIKALSIILDRQQYEIEDIVKELKNKSLLLHAYSEQLQTNVYGIHELVLSYLKQNMPKDEKMKLHENVIKNYLKLCDNDFSKLPDDNYIFTYIGYHLTEAGRTKEFSQIYFDLNFIAAKIRHCGIADLIGDYKRYMKYITNNEEPILMKKLETFNLFIQEYGQDVHRFPGVDIVQCALQQPVDSEVHRVALKHAHKECDTKLYFQTQFFRKTVYVVHTLDLKEDITATCYAHETDTILVGISSGEIQLWDHNYKSKLGTFTGHTEAITYLQWSSDNNIKQFLSVSKDGFVKIWSLEDACNKNRGSTFDQNGFDHIVPSPRIRQQGWMDLHTNNHSIDKSMAFSIKDDMLTCASFSNDNNYVVAGSNNGQIKIWRLSDQEQMLTINSSQEKIICCTFSLRDALILFGVENRIFVYDTKFGTYLSHFMNDVRTTNLLVVPFVEDRIVAVSDSSVSVWSWKQKNKEDGGLDFSEPFKNILHSSDEASYICGAVTWDGVYAVAGSTDHNIRMWNIETGEKVKEFQEHNGLVMCLDTFLNDDTNSDVMYVLLSGSDNKTVKQWRINKLECSKNNMSKLLPNFSACWMYNSIPTIAAINSESKIQIFHGHAQISESEKLDSPKSLAFSKDGKFIAIGLNDGTVKIFDYRNKKMFSIMNLEGPISYMEYLDTGRNECNSSILVASSENSCLMVYKGKMAYRFKKPDILDNVRQGKSSVTVKSYYLRLYKSMITIDCDGSVKVCTENMQIDDILISSRPESTLTMSALTKCQKMIALIFSDGLFRIYGIGEDFNENKEKANSILKGNLIPCSFKHGMKFENEVLRSCCFSDDAKIFAVGADSGNVLLWSVEKRTQIAKLQLHQSWVWHLQFSPLPRLGAPLVLVSVGDQIVWWDITYIWDRTAMEIQRNNRSRSSIKLEKRPENLDISNNLQILSLSDDDWIGKKGRPEKPELLAAIKTGQYASTISASPGFNSFVTVDSGGQMYILNILKPPDTENGTLNDTF